MNKGLLPYGSNPFCVGLARFELAASSSRTKRATKLRHSPMLFVTTGDRLRVPADLRNLGVSYAVNDVYRLFITLLRYD